VNGYEGTKTPHRLPKITRLGSLPDQNAQNRDSAALQMKLGIP